MVFCEYISNTADTARYSFGTTEKDMTGEVVFHFVENYIEVVSEPVLEMAPIRHMLRLARKEKAHFLDGVFNKHISYVTC